MNKQEKIQRFLDDKVMSTAVYEVLRGVFTKTRKGDYPDVNFLAAERIAADLLEEGWVELKRSIPQVKVETEAAHNVGL